MESKKFWLERDEIELGNHAESAGIGYIIVVVSVATSATAYVMPLSLLHAHKFSQGRIFQEITWHVLFRHACWPNTYSILKSVELYWVWRTLKQPGLSNRDTLELPASKGRERWLSRVDKITVTPQDQGYTTSSRLHHNIKVTSQYQGYITISRLHHKIKVTSQII